MPSYVWECLKCAEEVEVERKMADSDVGPDGLCECGSANFKKIIKISKGPNFILESGGTGWHRDHYTRTGRSIK